jgi:hypothetical protein
VRNTKQKNKKYTSPKERKIIMSQTNTSSTNIRFTIDFVNKEIHGSKTSFNKAGKGFGAEFEELSHKMALFPDYKLVFTEQKRKNSRAKRTYSGMSEKFILDYVAIQANAEALRKELNEVVTRANEKGYKVFPAEKTWFLKKFSTKEMPFDMKKAKDDIYNAMLFVPAKETAAKSQDSDSHESTNTNQEAENQESTTNVVRMDQTKSA